MDEPKGTCRDCTCSNEAVLLRRAHDLLEWFAADGFNDEVDEMRTRDLLEEIEPAMCHCEEGTT